MEFPGNVNILQSPNLYVVFDVLKTILKQSISCKWDLDLKGISQENQQTAE